MADGSVLVLDVEMKAINRVNPVTGAVGTVSQCADQSSCTVGTGPAFSFPLGIAVGPDGAIFVTDGALYAVMRVDPVTGNRAIVSSPSVGSGPGPTGS